MSSQQDEQNRSFVIFDGLPIVTRGRTQSLLTRFFLRKLRVVDVDDHAQVIVPVNQQGLTLGFAVVRYTTAEEAIRAIANLNDTALDQNHTMTAATIGTSPRYAEAVRDAEIDAANLEALKVLVLSPWQ